ncbi:hypothetical protein [Haloferula sp.]|uniref:hypothetical protein n=1 Tax=Haloferula sp. TaxID=2497595 RepID=UPI00329BF9B7
MHPARSLRRNVRWWKHVAAGKYERLDFSRGSLLEEIAIDLLVVARVKNRR